MGEEAVLPGRRARTLDRQGHGEADDLRQRVQVETERSQDNPQYLAAVRLGVTIVVLLLLAGSMLLVWLMDDRNATRIIALVATLLGWVVTLMLPKRSAESPTSITNANDDNSSS